jgi:hydrogenase nickel incorporation protein HypA/HybF
MHELNLCISLIQTLQQSVQKADEEIRQIKKIWIEVGELAGIELDALLFSFPIAAKGTIAENSMLEIITIKGQAWCENCQQAISIKTLFHPCQKCNCYTYNVTQGKEFRLLKIGVG